jgi:autophagy-related protein 101
MCWTKSTVHNSFLTGCQIIITIAEKKLKKNWFSTGEEEVPWERWYVSCRTLAEHWKDTYEGHFARVINAELRQPKTDQGKDFQSPRRQRL